MQVLGILCIPISFIRILCWSFFFHSFFFSALILESNTLLQPRNEITNISLIVFFVDYKMKKGTYREQMQTLHPKLTINKEAVCLNISNVILMSVANRRRHTRKRKRKEQSNSSSNTSSASSMCLPELVTPFVFVLIAFNA